MEQSIRLKSNTDSGEVSPAKQKVVDENLKFENFIKEIGALKEYLKNILESEEKQGYNEDQLHSLSDFSILLDVDDEKAQEESKFYFNLVENQLYWFLNKDLIFSTSELLKMKQDLNDKMLVEIHNSQIFQTALAATRDFKNQGITSVSLQDIDKKNQKNLWNTVRTIRRYLLNFKEILDSFEKNEKNYKQSPILVDKG